MLQGNLQGGLFEARDRIVRVGGEELLRGGGALSGTRFRAVLPALSLPCLLYTSPSPRDCS